MNITNIVNKDLCMGCGTCKSICPNSAINIILNEQRGLYIPVVDSNKCVDCSLCYKVCPGHSVDFKGLNQKIFNKEPENPRIGNYIDCYIGHSENNEIRHNSSSGGLVTSLLTYAIED